MVPVLFMKKGNMFWSNCRRKKLLLCQIVSVNISRKVAKGTFSSSLRIEFWWNHLPHPGSAQLKVWAGADLFTFSLPPEPLPLSSKLVHGGVELLPKCFVEETIGSGRWIHPDHRVSRSGRKSNFRPVRHNLKMGNEWKWWKFRWKNQRFF